MLHRNYRRRWRNLESDARERAAPRIFDRASSVRYLRFSSVRRPPLLHRNYWRRWRNLESEARERAAPRILDRASSVRYLRFSSVCRLQLLLPKSTDLISVGRRREAWGRARHRPPLGARAAEPGDRQCICQCRGTGSHLRPRRVQWCLKKRGCETGKRKPPRSSSAFSLLAQIGRAHV